mmetsp:Transcript_111283/g.314113  ORF Transcript_111283/g.314113 Transcript_111283/m.314113 type:complete len:207 (-) Transcript_111283:307-927(-)
MNPTAEAARPRRRTGVAEALLPAEDGAAGRAAHGLRPRAKCHPADTNRSTADAQASPEEIGCRPPRVSPLTRHPPRRTPGCPPRRGCSRRRARRPDADPRRRCNTWSKRGSATATRPAARGCGTPRHRGAPPRPGRSISRSCACRSASNARRPAARAQDCNTGRKRRCHRRPLRSTPAPQAVQGCRATHARRRRQALSPAGLSRPP